jgi:hypothetical protein
MSRDERSKPVLCISFDFWYYLYCMESYKKNHVCDVINLILYSNFVFTICVKYWEDSWKTIISDLHKTIFINYPISAQKFIFQIFCWNFRQRCLLGSLRAELYWIFYITVFSYFFVSDCTYFKVRVGCTRRYMLYFKVIVFYREKPFVVGRVMCR